MSFATPPVSDALGNSKGVMSQDLGVSLPCRCDSRTVPNGDIRHREGKFSDDLLLKGSEFPKTAVHQFSISRQARLEEENH
jgi:hypothetical protein